MNNNLNPYQLGRKPDPIQAARIFGPRMATPMLAPRTSPPRKPEPPKPQQMMQPVALAAPSKTAEDRSEEFKLGFLAKVAELGYTPSEFFVFLKKAFIDPEKMFDKFTDKTIGLGGDVLSKGWELGASAAGTAGRAALWAPVALGGAHGVARELLETPTPEDVDLLRKMETLGLYRRLTNEIRQRMTMRRGPNG